MPLLRGKPFRPKTPTKELKKDSEVFFHELTGEVFTDYDEFFERVILCNSLLWTCKCTGHNGLTFKEAIESEESVKEALAAIPFGTKKAVLALVHHTKRSRIADLCEEIIDYLKKRYQEGEIIEVKVKDQWKKAKVEKVIAKNKVASPSTTPKKQASQSTPSKGTPGKKTPKKNEDDHSSNVPLSPGGRKLSLETEAEEFEYEVKLMKSDGASSVMKFQDKSIRRSKGSLTRELVRLLLRQTCKRTTMSSDEGYWVVEANFVEKYSLGQSSIGSGPLSLETPLKLKNKRKRSAGKSEGEQSPTKKRKSSDSGNAASPSKDKKTRKPKDKTRKKSVENGKDGSSKSPGKKSKSEEKVKELTPAQKKKLLEKKKLKEIADKEKLKKKKLLEREKERERLKKEKEEEKIKRKVEKEKEKERATEIRKLEAEFMKEWIKIRDDLKLEDLKELPEPISIPTKIQGELFGDVIMVVEFLNIFGTFYDLKDTLQQEMTYELIEKAVHEHDAEGTFYDIVKFLLQTFLSVSKEENEEEANDDESSNGTATPDEPEPEQEQEEEKQYGHVSSNATAAAAWPMLHQGMALDELTIDPFTLSEILRLHILSSGVRIGGQRNMWQRKGGFQFSDDPCVDFRHREKSILTTLHTSCLYDLSVQDKLKLLCVLCNQILTLTTTRDYIEDSFEKVKELKKKLRELQNAEHKRRKLDSAERWRKRMEESARRREEIEKRKKEKEAREGESNKKEKGATEEESSQANTQEEKEEKVVEKRKRGRKPKHIESKTEQAESSQSQDSKVDQDVEMVVDTETKKEEQTQEEKEAELRKREEFKNEEKQLIAEIAKHSSVRSEAPLGLDRIYSRYWSFRYVDGLLIEADDVGRKLAEYVVDEDDDDLDVDLADDGVSKGDVDSVADSTDGKEQEQRNKEDFPKISLSDIIELRNSGKPVTDQLFLRYRCRVNEERLSYVSQSKLISTALGGVQNGIDPRCYADKPMQLWSAYIAREQLDGLIDGMNTRGAREMILKTKLENMMDSLYMGIDNCKLMSIKAVEEKPAKVRPPKGDIIDKSLFRNIEDFLEANLRDQLLDFEERLWQASLGIIKVENREDWREDIGTKINDLLWGKDGSPVEGELNTKPGSLVGELKKEGDENIENGVSPHDKDTAEKSTAMDVDQVANDLGHNSSAGQIKQSKEKALNGDINLGTADATNIPKASFKALPLKFIEQNAVKEENSRCNTPVNVATPMLNARVKDLALNLLKIEKGIDQKYLKPPLGEDEETKKERIREMIEAAHVEFHDKIDKSKRDSSGSKKKQTSNKTEAEKNDVQAEVDDDAKSVTSTASDEALKKEITSLARWETSLNAATNFSQIFIHLNTLDRSVMWDKSVLNARCRLCRKKGDAEKMLLCDGCDRGFHMYCLKPPVKKIPVGDWFCVDCRPKEPKRTQRARKRPSKLEEYVEDVVVSQSSDESGEEEVEENDSDGEESEEEESDEEPVDVHDDFCSVCEELGDLLCCDICSRAFHVGCVYPPIRKAPRGDWSCQICTGADSDLPKARRVQTIEREREKRIKSESKASQAKKAKPTRKSADPPKPTTRDRKRHSSPGPAASKRQKAESSKIEKRKPSGSSARRSIGDPTAFSSRRKSDTFGRYERRLCSKILEELINADDGEPFLLPVDVKVVPDYLEFIDNPMDLSTMKCKLNKGSYDTLEEFLADVRLIFSNCDTYNPPRSGVARAGSRLSIYFEQRLRELELVKM